MPSFLDRLEAPFREERYRKEVRWVWEIILPLTLLALATVLIRVNKWDQSIQTAIFERGDGSWSLGDSPFWQAIYLYGTAPAAIVTIALLIGFLLSGVVAQLRPWRRSMLFVVLAFALGPGAITNGLLKEHWGRPRPREVETHGGRYPFEPILARHEPSDGKSFPCGHATVGFIFLAGYFIARRYRRWIALGFLGLGVVWGGILGWARMLQGGHYFSDVIWALAVVYFSCLGLYFALGLHRRVRRESTRQRLPKWALAAGGAIGIATVAAVLLATPYRDSRVVDIVEEAAKTGPIHLHLGFVVGDIEIRGGDRYHIERTAWGHGVPTSRIAIWYREHQRDDHWQIVYAERLSGRFTEIEQDLSAEMPWERVDVCVIDIGAAEVTLNLDTRASGVLFQVVEGTGTLRILANGIAVDHVGPDSRGIEATAHREAESLPQCRIEIHEEFKGELSVVKSES
ncbi:MAG: phosphatase PAP2 family protein [Verrucomicrobiota bacterium]